MISWASEKGSDYLEKSYDVGVLAVENEDIRSVQEIIMTGLMGLSAYHSHAYKLGHTDESVFDFTRKALMVLADETNTLEDYISLIDETGEIGVKAMAILDKANTTTFGNPEMSSVNIGVENRPGILVSGHDLNDIKQPLEQTKNKSIDIYTHSEMCPAHYYLDLKKYEHLYGNYGSASYNQKKEFKAFNGPILFTKIV